MNFQDPKIHNEALIAKQSWRILEEANSLLHRLLKAKYFPNAFFASEIGLQRFIHMEG